MATHTLSVSASPSSTHFHSMRQWNRNLTRSLRTPEAEDRREKLSVDDGTLHLNCAHVRARAHTHTYIPPHPCSYPSSSMHHSPSSRFASFTIILLFLFVPLHDTKHWNLLICKETKLPKARLLWKNKKYTSHQHKSKVQLWQRRAPHPLIEIAYLSPLFAWKEWQIQIVC